MWMFLSFLVVSVFSFISVAVWAGTKHQERKDFYRSETLKKLAESGSAAVLEYLREEERLDEKRRAEQRVRMFEGNRLGGLILVVVGGVLTVTFYQLVPNMPVYLFGLIPIGIGLVLLVVSSTGARRS
jgi:peptidoglycan/LPS O-acetylase OafA/YrhL